MPNDFTIFLGGILVMEYLCEQHTLSINTPGASQGDFTIDEGADEQPRDSFLAWLRTTNQPVLLSTGTLGNFFGQSSRAVETFRDFSGGIEPIYWYLC